MKYLYNSNFLAVFFLILLSIPALKSLAIPGFYTSHDGETHTARIAQYYQALIDGQFPPRWAKTLNDGLGSPIFVYIYPAPYFFGGAVHTLGFSFVNSFKILMSLTFIFSGIFSYLWLKEIWKIPRAAFIGAIFYTWVPYRLSLIYVRASISESFAYTFLPMTLWSITKLENNLNLRWAAISALSFSFLLLSQNLVAVISMPLILVYSLLIFLKKKNPKFLAFLIGAISISFTASAFTYLPSLFERNFIHFDETFYRVFDSHFVTLSQLIHSPWGYGFDFPGQVNDEISFQIGLAHILVFIFSSILLVISLIPKKINLLLNEVSYFNLSLVFLFLIIFISTIFLMIESPLTLRFWNAFKPITIIDIPWRFLGITAITSSFLAAFVTAKIRPGLFTILLLIAVIVANRNHLRINKSIFYSDEHFLNFKGTATQLNEFTPKWRTSTKAPSGFRNMYEIVEGSVQINNFKKTSNRLSFSTESDSKSQVRINLLYFPNWEIFLDGQKLDLDKDYSITSYVDLSKGDDINLTGLFEIKPPIGRHEYSFKFEETPLRKFANRLSLISFLVILIMLIPNYKQPRLNVKK